jgi:hypothetical protein
MSQHDMVIDNGPGLGVRTDIIAALQALASCSLGPIEPTVMYAGQLWLDTSVAAPGLLRMRDQSNAAWIDVPLAGMAGFVAKTGDTMTGTLNGTDFVASGSVTAPASFIGGTVQTVLGNAASVAAPVYIRPNGYNSGSNQFTFAASGALTAPGSVSTPRSFIGTFSGTGVTAGSDESAGRKNSSANIGTVFSHQVFYNTNGQVGNINTNASATNYVASSDENLKEYNADMDPAEAIAIIRADPVLAFTWKATGESAIGWFAQKSYAVAPDLAVPPSEPTEGESKPAFGEEGYEPWGIDYGRRTPYLWAALTGALDQIDQLTARIAALEAAAAPS